MKPIQFSILADCVIWMTPQTTSTLSRILLAGICETAGTTIATAPAMINAVPRATSHSQLSLKISAP